MMFWIKWFDGCAIWSFSCYSVWLVLNPQPKFLFLFSFQIWCRQSRMEDGWCFVLRNLPSARGIWINFDFSQILVAKFDWFHVFIPSFSWLWRLQPESFESKTIWYEALHFFSMKTLFGLKKTEGNEMKSQ